MPASAPGPLEPNGLLDQWLLVNGGYLGGGCLGFFGFGIVYMGYAWIAESLKSRRIYARMGTWPAAPGRVIESRVSTSQMSDSLVDQHRPVIEYRFIVNGESYKSINVLPFEFDETTVFSDAEVWVLAYPVGQAIEVYYNPRNPKECVIERQTQDVRRVAGERLWSGFIALAVGLGALYATWRLVWPHPGNPTP